MVLIVMRHQHHGSCPTRALVHKLKAEGAIFETVGTSRLKYCTTSLQLLATFALFYGCCIHYLGCGRFQHLKINFLQCPFGCLMYALSKCVFLFLLPCCYNLSMNHKMHRCIHE
ncbi:hypothetical protein PVAP13_4NG215676 [Panicum virgatum]|uniref:Uncharacterized protein n=1 Tax=Panicum virgatum TaxID=38727 RepID=A0A8T0TFH5_PANVG|nr:hypothetical protein PVAP13_4NG215676 [Panicum virgatum]